MGSAVATPTCSFVQLVGPGSCPPDTQIGLIRTHGGTTSEVDGPVFNITPERGVVAEFGFIDALKVSHLIYVSIVRSANGYVIRATSPEIPQVELRDITVTLFGDPALRDGTGNTQVALFTNPSSCGGEPLAVGLHLDSWQNPSGHTGDGLSDFSDPAWAGAARKRPL